MSALVLYFYEKNNPVKRKPAKFMATS